MLAIEKIDTADKKQVQRFINLPYHLYRGHPNWVPPLVIDVKMQLDRQKHPFFEHSDADYFLAVRDRRVAGRIAALENRSYNRAHGVREAQFYLFDCENDPEAAAALFGAAFEWAYQRGLDHMVGPKGFSPFDGYGLLVEGFEHRQMMNMMNYNEPYYIDLVEAQGFEKEVDFVSCYLSQDDFKMPERIHRIAERVLQRGALQVRRFNSKRDLKAWANRIGRAYNQTFINNWEYYPLTDREIQFVVDTLMQVADPRLIKIITHQEDVVGFLLAFHDVSAALQRANGRLLPTGLPDILLEIRRTKWVSLNGAGVLPEFQGRGGNALLYSEIEKTIREYGFQHAELTQVAETAVQMRQDLANVGSDPYKNHRIFRRRL
jgi:GNAT superfamily N-acetyltransferase